MSKMKEIYIEMINELGPDIENWPLGMTPEKYLKERLKKKKKKPVVRP